MKRTELIEKLQLGEVIVNFTKKDGTERVMKCTLSENLIPVPNPVIDPKPSTKKPNDEVLAVWDLEKSAWRSFRLDSINSVE